MSADVHDRTPVVKIELQLRPSPPADARPHWHGYGCLAFYDGPAYAEGRVVTVWENDLHLMAERSSWSAKVEQRDGSGWVLVLRLVHEKAREALAALNLPDFIAPAVAGEPESTPAAEPMGVQDWIGQYLTAQKRFEDVCVAVLTKIADGGQPAQVIDVVGEWMDGCDCLDDEVIALFHRAARSAAGGASADTQEAPRGD